ncbi:venom allergen 3-like [Bicyclus anynana]|uniref:Venom allergen 3-like n=1 Tax=Bicyclus anynana TaxID=110368 RepID=A0ABM3M1V7_BICAN|nr:venom allergen 3-like [Bicyclus anynana]
MPTILLLALLSLSHSALVDDRTYCAPRFNRLCQGKGRHVACQFPNPGAGPSCQNYTRIQFTSDLKHFLLHYINKRRQRVATGGETVRGGVRLPRPQIMMLVSWDLELATLAQRLADQCSFAHDECRATVRYPYPGQSIGEVRWRGVGGEAVALGVHRALRRVLDAWCGERRRVFARQLTAPFKLTRDMSWGHFSQLIVWRLSAVGCGAARHGDQRQRLLLVCDFSHTNMLGQRTIVPGPLAQCPTLTVRRPSSAYPLLCAPAKRATPAENYQESIKEYDYNIDTDSGEDDEGYRTTKVIDRTIENRKGFNFKTKMETNTQSATKARR